MRKRVSRQSTLPIYSGTATLSVSGVTETAPRRFFVLPRPPVCGFARASDGAAADCRAQECVDDVLPGNSATLAGPCAPKDAAYAASLAKLSKAWAIACGSGAQMMPL